MTLHVMRQMTLDVSPTGATLRDEAIERVTDNADDDWLDAAARAIRYVATRDETFTTDQVWEVLEQWDHSEPHEKRAMGGAMVRALRAQVCFKTGAYRPSKRPICKARPIPIYRSGNADATQS